MERRSTNRVRVALSYIKYLRERFLETLDFITRDVQVYGYEEPQKEIVWCPENLERLRKYVENRLRTSGVIPEWHCNSQDPTSVASRIVYTVWREMPRLMTIIQASVATAPRSPKEFVDFYIDLEIKYPPPLTDQKHFSLKEYIKAR